MILIYPNERARLAMKIIVIGLGSMGKRRIRLLQKMDKSIEIVGIDSKKERVEEVKEQYGIGCVTDLVNMPNDVDCAFVCTSPQYHADIIRECLKRDCHVFSEINLIDDGYEENVQMAKQKGKVLFLSSTPLYKAEMQYIDCEVKKSKKELVYNYHVGQYLPDWHPWDNLKEFFIGKKETNGCRELLAIELPWLQNTFGKIVDVHVIKRKITSLQIDFPDAYMIQVEHENGNIGSLLIDVVSRQAVRHLEVVGEDIYIRWDGTPDSLQEQDIDTGELKRILMGEYIHKEGYGEFINEYAYLKEIQAFFDVIKGKEMIYGFENDKEILKWIDRIEN